MAEIVKDFWAGMPLGLYIWLILIFILVIASWIAPPIAVISKSALEGAAMLLAAGWLYYITANIPTILASGAKIRASYGNAQIEIGRHKHNNEEKEEEDTSDGFENTTE